MNSQAHGETEGMQRTADPVLRKGIDGFWDRLAGPGASRAENALNLCWAFLFPALVMAYVALNNLDWSPLQFLAVLLIAFDIGGGISVNASPSARRWWHRAEQGFRQHFSFAAAHLHPFVIALLFPAFGWAEAGAVYIYLLVAALAILRTPRDLQRTLAFVLYSIALLISIYFLHPPAGLEWFVPFFYLKLLIAHLPGDHGTGFGAQRHEGRRS